MFDLLTCLLLNWTVERILLLLYLIIVIFIITTFIYLIMLLMRIEEKEKRIVIKDRLRQNNVCTISMIKHRF